MSINILISSRIPGQSNHQVNCKINGYYITNEIRTGSGYSEKAFTPSSNDSSGSVDVIGPSRQRLFHGGCDNGWSYYY